MTQKIRMKIFVAMTDHFELLADNVLLEFSDNCGTFPLPRNKDCYNALLSQHPEIYDAVPMFNETRKRGLCFDRVR